LCGVWEVYTFDADKIEQAGVNKPVLIMRLKNPASKTGFGPRSFDPH
jgi:hypothetical protein